MITGIWKIRLPVIYLRKQRAKRTYLQPNCLFIWFVKYIIKIVVAEHMFYMVY